MIRTGAIIGMVLLLAACKTPEQKAEEYAQELKGIIAEYEAPCDKAGFKKGTQANIDCMVKLHRDDENAAAAAFANRPRHTSCTNIGGMTNCTTD